MKRLFILLLFVLLLTGCDVTYNLEINGNVYEETTNILEKYDDIYSNNNFNNIYEDYGIFLKKPIPLSKNVMIISESDVLSEGVDYYKVKNLEDGTYFGLEYKGVFNKIPFNESNIISFGVGNFSISESDNYVSINIPNNIKAFYQFDNLNKITVNIKTDKKVASSNADKVKDNVYTWIITRDNYKDKNIKIVLTDKDGVSSGNPMITFTIALFIIIIIFVIIYLLIKMRYKKKNVL